MTEAPRIEVTIAAPVEAVWDALRDRDRLRNWHGWEFEGLDAEIEEIYFASATADPATHVLDTGGGDVFQVSPHGSGARVTLTRPSRGTDPEWDAYYDDITEGWITFLHQLRFAVERHAGESRRTLFFGGEPVRSSGPIDELALAEVAGTGYDADLLGERVSGTVFFRSEHQVGLSVDQWGDGLLVLLQVEPSESKPNGAAMAVLTTYRLDDSAYDALRGRWESWWNKRYSAQT